MRRALLAVAASAMLGGLFEKTSAPNMRFPWTSSRDSPARAQGDAAMPCSPKQARPIASEWPSARERLDRDGHVVVDRHHEPAAHDHERADALVGREAHDGPAAEAAAAAAAAAAALRVVVALVALVVEHDRLARGLGERVQTDMYLRRSSE